MPPHKGEFELEKIESIGVCDNCKTIMPDELWYTDYGIRLFCSFSCQQGVLSVATGDARSIKMRERYALGTSKRPDLIRKALNINISEGRKKSTAKPVSKPEGFNSGKQRPRTRIDNPVLYEAQRKLNLANKEKREDRYADMTPEEREAIREYQQQHKLKAREKQKKLKERFDQWSGSYQAKKRNGKMKRRKNKPRNKPEE